MNQPQLKINPFQELNMMPMSIVDPNFQFYLQNYAKNSQKKEKVKKVRESRWAKGKWTAEEQKGYIEFVMGHKEELQSRLSRKSNKIFLKMSNMIKTRSAEQTRSHHQKMLFYKNTLEEIISSYSYLMKGKLGNQEKTNLPVSHDEIINQKGIRAIGNQVFIVIHASDIASY